MRHVTGNVLVWHLSTGPTRLWKKFDLEFEPEIQILFVLPLRKGRGYLRSLLSKSSNFAGA